MTPLQHRFLAILSLLLISLFAAGCGPEETLQNGQLTGESGGDSPGIVDPLATAAAEATAIVRQAQATALVLRAESEAQATIDASRREAADNGSDTGSNDQREDSILTSSPPPVLQATAVIPVKVLAVGFAAEGGMIQVRFQAPVDVADRWLQGQVYIIDEESGREYKEIPVMPRIGPLFGKPARQGQNGYFMLVNGPQPLGPGAAVTVVLGDHIEEGWRLP